MADNSKIEWTDASWNPLRARDKTTGKVGWHCEHKSPGCSHCYSELFNGRNLPSGGTGLSFTRKSRDQVETFLDERMLSQPCRWKRPRKVFVCSMTDLFGEWVTDEQIDRVFAVMNACYFTLPISETSRRWHTFQVLTKRGDRMRDYMLSRSQRFEQGEHPVILAGRAKGGALRGLGSEIMGAGACLQWPPPNVWLGVSAEDQQRYDERAPQLVACPAAMRFISYEPAIGPIEFGNLTGIHWVIVGGESGPKARPFNLAWAHSTITQTGTAGVACFVKQLGAKPFEILNPQDGAVSSQVRLDDRKGGDWDEWPDYLRVREYPQPEPAHAS